MNRWVVVVMIILLITAFAIGREVATPNAVPIPLPSQTMPEWQMCQHIGGMWYESSDGGGYCYLGP